MPLPMQLSAFVLQTVVVAYVLYTLQVQLISKYKPQIIAHYAAINGTQYFYDIPHLVAEVNSISSYNLLNYIKEVQENHLDYKPDFIFASTSEVYGEPFELPSTENAITYLRIDEKRDSYAAAKLMSEFYVKLFCESLNINWIIFKWQDTVDLLSGIVWNKWD